MGRRSRKRRAASASAAVAERPAPAHDQAPARKRAAPPPERAPSRKPNPRSSRHLDEGPPKAPWHPFPLAELCIFLSLILVIVGFIVWGHTGQILVGAGAVLGALATLEFTIREHVAGYRSHSTLIAGFFAVTAGIVTVFAGLPRIATIVVVVVIFAAAFAGLRELFKRQSGGLGWRGGLK